MSHEPETTGAVRAVDLHDVRPYGDTMNDGIVQLSFSLPVALSEEAREAARRLASKMGLQEPQVYHEADLGHGHDLRGRVISSHCIDGNTHR